jgi:hypothetical protein
MPQRHPSKICLRRESSFAPFKRFSSAHFTIFSDGSRERLHGHNFTVAVDVQVRQRPPQSALAAHLRSQGATDANGLFETLPYKVNGSRSYCCHSALFMLLPFRFMLLPYCHGHSLPSQSLKDDIRSVCGSLDERVLLPALAHELCITPAGNSVEVRR